MPASAELVIFIVYGSLEPDTLDCCVVYPNLRFDFCFRVREMYDLVLYFFRGKPVR